MMIVVHKGKGEDGWMVGEDSDPFLTFFHSVNNDRHAAKREEKAPRRRRRRRKNDAAKGKNE